MSIMDPTVVPSSKKRKQGASTNEPSRKSRKLSQETSQESKSESDDNTGEQVQPVKANKHSKKERKQNRSTRIHSIRKLLARDTLPSTIRQERERELSALLLEQEQGKAKKQSKKTLEKYHYVRFVERMKAEKKLKQLKKKQSHSPDDSSLKSKIHNMEVNHNYAIYAPLSEKYVSVFASASNQSADDDRGGQGSKPPMWYAIEKAMSEGDKALVAIREGKSSNRPEPDQEVNGGKPTKKQKKQDAMAVSSRSGRMEQHIESKLTTSTSESTQQEQINEEDLSDGGFFER